MENITDTRPQMWSTEEIRELILYAKDMEKQVEDMKANLITMDAKLKNEEAKVRRLTLTLKQFMNI
jgi:erythromycin esterase-like protein